MQTTDQEQKQSKGLKARLMNWLGLTNEITIKPYHGYGHADQMTTYGHIFKLSPLPRKKYRKSFIYNTLALLRLFMVKPYPHLEVEMQWGDQVFQSKTDETGFYKFDWKDDPPHPKGWQEIIIRARKNGSIIAESTGHVYIPYPTQYGFISDIDDTFLISHSSNLRKRLFVLFTENARSRRPFDGVVKHYQLLSHSNTTPQNP
ncbi:MAG TPA: phosphatase domain-containing protein, partial [Flavisolibacter sp.]